MNNDYILQSDLLDLVFEKRNKIYGAYNLRKFYSNRLFKAVGITFSLAILASVFFIFAVKKSSSITIPDIITVGGTLAPLPPEVPKEPVKPKTSPDPSRRKASTTKFLSTISITSSTKVDVIPNNFDSLEIGSETEKGEMGVHTVIPAGPGDAGTIIKFVDAAPAINKDIPLETAEVMPSYPGGIEALRKFLMRNLQNPAEIADGTVVSVKINFVVGFDGELKGFKTVEDGGKVFNNEVIRVLKKMPKWVPGKSRGENVSVYYNIPVKFQAADE